LICPKEEEVIALLDARDESTPTKVLGKGICQPLVIGLCKLYPASIFFRHILKSLKFLIDYTSKVKYKINC
jgi:hypothetical protein